MVTGFYFRPAKANVRTQLTPIILIRAAREVRTRALARAKKEMRANGLSADSASMSQRGQELDDSFLIAGLQFSETLGYLLGFAAVPYDGVMKGERSSVVHQPRPQADSPERRGAYLVATALKVLFREILRHHFKDFVAALLAGCLQDSGPGPDVMNYEVPPGVECDVPERGVERKCSAFDPVCVRSN